MRRLGELAREYRAECVVELIWHGCLTYDIEAAYTRELAAQFGLPYLRIETEYSPNDDARIALRLGALYETVRAARR